MQIVQMNPLSLMTSHLDFAHHSAFSPLFLKMTTNLPYPILFPEFGNLLEIDDCQYHLAFGCLFGGALGRVIWNTRTLAQISSHALPS
jgi:hypothetical protein